MLDTLNLYPEAFGIDISDGSIKIVKLKKKSQGFGLACFGETVIKPGIIKNGEIKKEDDLVKILKKAITQVKGEKLKTPYAIASLPEEKGFLRVIQMPKMKEEELKEAVYFEAENYIPLPLENVEIDFQIIPSVNDKQGRLEILLAAIPKKVVNPYIDCLKKAGIQPLALEIESSAVCRALINNKKITTPILLIDLGLSRTSFMFFSDNSLRSTCSIPISSYGFSEAISRFLGIDFKRAEGLKIRYGLQSPKKVILKGKEGGRQFKKKTMDDKKVFEALIPALVDLSQQIKKYLDFYRSRNQASGEDIEKILLCGGGAYLKGLDNFLYLETKLPVEIGNPWVNISKQPLLPLDQSLKYVTAIGLALRGVKHET